MGSLNTHKSPDVILRRLCHFACKHNGSEPTLRLYMTRVLLLYIIKSFIETDFVDFLYKVVTEHEFILAH